MTDLALAPIAGPNPQWDLIFQRGDFVPEAGLYNAVLISLLTDARCEPDELPPGEIDPRGWCGEDADDPWGSKLWLLARAKQTAETRRLAEQYTEQSLAWMLRDGIADSVTATGTWARVGVLTLAVEIHRPAAPPVRFGYDLLWTAEPAALASARLTQQTIRIANTLQLVLTEDWPDVLDWIG